MTPSQHGDSAIDIATFSDQEVAGLPPVVASYFRSAIAPGTALTTRVRLSMRGHIWLGRWVPFHAHEELDPHSSLVWTAHTAGGLLSGSDRYADGRGVMRWRALGLVPVMSAEGPDVSRSAAGRCAGEGVFVPTAMLPRFGVSWSDTSPQSARASFDVDDTHVDIDCEFDKSGQIRTIDFQRWGDPNRENAWQWHRFGGDVTGHRTFGGLTIPSSGRFGWNHGRYGWSEGEFFRFTITGLQPLPLTGPESST